MTIRQAQADDAGQILVVQRAAYVLDAQLYGDPMIDALTETFEDVLAAVADAVLLVALDGDRLVGFVRGRLNGRSCRLDRLAVAPDRQGGGIGGALVQAIEADVGGLVDELVADEADRGQARVRLYQRHGFAEVYRDAAGAGRVRIYLRKDLIHGNGKNGRDKNRNSRGLDGHGTTDDRSMDGHGTKDDRRMNGRGTEDDRRMNGRGTDNCGVTDAGQERLASTPVTPASRPPSPLLAPPSRPWEGTHPDHPTGR